MLQRRERLGTGGEVSREIPIQYIASVESKANFFDGGYFRLVLGGQQESSWYWRPSKDPYTVRFSYWQRKPFKALRQALDRRIAQRQGPAEVPDSIPAMQVPAEPGEAPTRPEHLEFEVNGKPDVVLKMLRAFFESDEWPYRTWRVFSFSRTRGEVWSRNSGPENIFFGRGDKVSALLSKPTLLDTPGGIVVSLILYVITFGAFMVAHLIWFLLFGPRVVAQVMVAADPIGEGATRLKVTARGKWGTSKLEYAEPVVAWIQRELVENNAAAAVEALPQPTPATDILAQVRDKLAPQRPAPLSDIPDQIRKLAQLRDAGAISNEEFEAKKRDLLDRM